MHKDKEYFSEEAVVLPDLQHYGYLTYMYFYHIITVVIVYR